MSKKSDATSQDTKIPLKDTAKDTTKNKEKTTATYHQNSADFTDEDNLVLLTNYVQKQHLVKQHIDSYNTFISNGLEQIITRIFSVEGSVNKEGSSAGKGPVPLKTIKFSITFTQVDIKKPVKSTNDPNSNNVLYPYEARKLGINYSAPLYIAFKVRAEAYPLDGSDPIIREEESGQVKIARIPIMVGSNRCNLHGLDRNTREELGEDPNDLGGYFIIKGEWVVNMIETRIFNYPHIFRNVGHKNELTRLEIITKPGDGYDNSSEIKIRYLNDDGIYISYSSERFLEGLNIPFYVIFKLFGMTTDREIFENIIYGKNSEDVISNNMLFILTKARRVTNAEFSKVNDPDITDLRQYVTNVLIQNYNRKSQQNEDESESDARKRDENLGTWLYSELLHKLDKFTITQVGFSPDKRHTKLRMLGDLIHDMLLTQMGIKTSTDRDSFKNKRCNTSGQSLSKIFKQYFNLIVVQKIRSRFTAAFTNTAFADVDLIKEVTNAIKEDELERAIIKSINTGDKEITIKNRSMPNRLASEQLNRKNDLNRISALRTLRVASSSTSRQDQRADEMRRVHPSAFNVVCPIQSAPTGEPVGMVKQMALSCTIVEASQSALLIDFMRQDPDLLPLDTLFPHDIYNGNLTKVMVNGIWLGCVTNSHEFIYRYKQYRRKFRYDFTTKKYSRSERFIINKHTTIHWDTTTNKIYFWLDSGRALYPLFVVRNNTVLDPIGMDIIGTEYDFRSMDGFIQDIMLTMEQKEAMNLGNLSFSDLIDLGAVDMVAPEELENCLVAESIEALSSMSNNPQYRFTHVTIPAAILGLPAATCPYAAHNQPPRITFQTSQGKQTCGIPCLNWHKRYDKHIVIQLYNEMPLTPTIANVFTYPNGANAITAIIADGDNQEDSLISNASSMESGLYTCLAGQYMMTEKEINEEFGIPNPVETLDFNKFADYSKLDKNGVIRVGQVVGKNTILVGKIEAQKDEIDGKKYTDRSLNYNKSEEAIVTDIIVGTTAKSNNDNIKVMMYSERVCGTGEKFSSRHGQKGMTSMDVHQADMPLTLRDGLSPDIILNPHAIPSRMTIGQLIETVTNKANALRGTFSDSTAFTKIDTNAAETELLRFGYDPNGTERMYDGRTGLWIDKPIFIGPTYYQRLQKFGVEEVYAISRGPTCRVTRQPIDGRARSGGLRHGEMEVQCGISQDIPIYILEKTRENSDGAHSYCCRKCGNRNPIVNESLGTFICKVCKKNGVDPDIAIVPGCWTSNVVFPNEINAIGIGMRFIPNQYDVDQ